MQLATWAWWCWTPIDGTATLPGVDRGLIGGMQVVGDDLRIAAKQLREPAHRFEEVAIGDCALEVAQVLAEDGVGSLEQADGGLELSADCEDGLVGREGQVQGSWDVAAGTTNRDGGVAIRVDHRVVDAPLDVAVVGEIRVGDVPQTLDGFVRCWRPGARRCGCPRS